jgi:hypothetical protein
LPSKWESGRGKTSGVPAVLVGVGAFLGGSFAQERTDGSKEECGDGFHGLVFNGEGHESMWSKSIDLPYK